MTNEEIAKAWFANIDANNFDAVKNMMDTKYQFYNPMTPGPMGVDEHLEMMQMFMQSAFKGQHHLELFISEGNYVTVKGRWIAKHIGEFNGIPRTEKQVQLSWIDIFHIVNGKVVDEYLEMNPGSIMAQIGAGVPTI